MNSEHVDIVRLGDGAIVSGLILGAIGVIIIDNKVKLAAAYALAGAVLSYFGFIHGAAIGIGESGLGVSPSIALGYLLLAGFLFSLQWAPQTEAQEA